jgi:g-D-glutamyl-meso-diaminopimelate peptidase
MYTYERLLSDIGELEGVERLVLGITWGGRIIPCVHVGSKRGRQLIVCAAIHAREHITAQLAMRLLGECRKRAGELFGWGIYFIPMANPDGVELCIRGTESVRSAWDRENVLKINGGCPDFSLWKANLVGIDLNVNFDARFGTGVSNVFSPAPENYVGEAPFSEPESRALVDFTKKVRPSAVISYHCKGEMIFWKFHQQANLLRDRILAEALAEVTGYELVDEMGSAGGYKDWCIQHLGIPAFTIEVGSDAFTHPFPYSELDRIFEQNRQVPFALIKNML